MRLQAWLAYLHHWGKTPLSCHFFEAQQQQQQEKKTKKKVKEKTKKEKEKPLGHHLPWAPCLQTMVSCHALGRWSH